MIGPAILCAHLLCAATPEAATAATAPADAAPPATPASFSLLVGGQAGTPHAVGLQVGLLSLRHQRPVWEVGLAWEPSGYLQSYSAGVAYHPFGNILFVAERVRYLQLHPPWSRGFDPDFDHQFAFGPELGVRGWIGPGRRLRGSLALGTYYIASGNMNLPLVLTLNAGLALCALDF
ncbi:MAG: hypothetical protein JXR83_15380 [Deltaproteobacteria bacterium]|nr:hypothetical protein [Deltaproteobacteria bacterium]